MNRSNLSLSQTDTPDHTDTQQDVFVLPLPMPRDIRSMREFMGMSHAELAGQLGVSTYILRNWELGRARITRALAEELRRMYDRKMGFDALD